MIEGITFKFEGGDADKHVIEARYYGAALIGLDKAVNDALLQIDRRRKPRRGERFGLYIVAKPPVAGSVDTPNELREIGWALPLVQEFILVHGRAYIEQFLAWLLKWHGGRRADAVEHMDKMIEMLKEANRHGEAESSAWRETMLALVDKLKPAAQDMVAPVGRSAGTLSIGIEGKPLVVVDEPMADAIRSKDEVEVLDMEELTFRIDGVSLHNRQLKVEFPDSPGKYFSADVRDPAFEVEGNPYIDAFVKSQTVTVQAKRALKKGELHRLYVMNFLKAA